MTLCQAVEESVVPVRVARGEAFHLGPFRVDPLRRRVAGPAGRAKSVEPRVMKVLAALARAEGAIVARDELLATCWPGMSVGADALTRAIGHLRRLGGDLGAFSIETVARVGYRLSATRDAGPGRVAVAAAMASPDDGPVAVLPFRNLSGDQRELADAICKDIVTALTRRPQFVRARTADTEMDDARTLRDRFVVSGSVRLNAQLARIAVQLCDEATGATLWAEQFKGGLTNAGTLQKEAVRRIIADVPATVMAWGAAGAVRRTAVDAAA